MNSLCTMEQLQREHAMMRFILKNHRSVLERSNAIRCHGEEGCLEPGSFWETDTVAWGVKRHSVVLSTGMGMHVIELNEEGEAKDQYFAYRPSLTQVECPFPAGHKIYQDAESWKRIAEAAREFDKIVG